VAWPEETSLSVSEAARLLRRHPEQVRRYLREGRLLGAVKLGLMWYIPRKAVLALAAELRRGAEEPPAKRMTP